MDISKQLFVNGEWRAPLGTLRTLPVIDPSTGRPFAEVALGSAADVDAAVAAARAAFGTFSQSTVESRATLLERILVAYERRYGDLVEAVSREMGAPRRLSHDAQVAVGQAHLARMVEVVRHYRFDSERKGFSVVKEAIGVVAMITPWNWPLNQITCKVAPALAAGCTMVLKPSEIAPFSAIVFAEIMQEAGVPRGVFNLVHGDGPTVGEALAAHPDVDMVSFTGSTRAGVRVAKIAADTVKRVHQELGGKSANIILRDADLVDAVSQGAMACFLNSGQSCNAPTRMFVPRERHDEAVRIAAGVAAQLKVGPANHEGVVLGPVVSQAQYDKVQQLIDGGIRQGAELAAGGLGRPDGLEGGYFIKPTVFGKVSPEMDIAREEIFGPVPSIIPYDEETAALQQANDTVYGLAAYIQTKNPDRAREIARQMRAGTVYINYPAWDPAVPFGGYKQSGNGREYGEFGLDEYLETKGIVGG